MICARLREIDNSSFVFIRAECYFSSVVKPVSSEDFYVICPRILRLLIGEANNLYFPTRVCSVGGCRYMV